jgi:hypothetical protein
MTQLFSKGSTFRTTLDFLAREAGADAVARVLADLPADARAAVQAAGATEELPFDLLLDVWRAADGLLGRERPDWIERSGAFSIESGGVRLYGGILRKASPQEFLTQRISLFRLYYRPGDMEVVEQAAGRAVLRLVGFPHGSVLFCRRQTGGLQRALELAGGGAPRVRHVRCLTEGDAFCEWELAWTLEGGEPERARADAGIVGAG